MPQGAAQARSESYAGKVPPLWRRHSGFDDATAQIWRRVCGFGSNSTNLARHSLFCSGKTAAGSGKGGSRADSQLGGKMRISMGVHSGGFAANFCHKMRGHCCRRGMSGFLASHATHNQRLGPSRKKLGREAEFVLTAV